MLSDRRRVVAFNIPIKSKKQKRRHLISCKHLAISLSGVFLAHCYTLKLFYRYSAYVQTKKNKNNRLKRSAIRSKRRNFLRITYSGMNFIRIIAITLLFLTCVNVRMFFHVWFLMKSLSAEFARIRTYVWMN